jgi:hypothetical protein
MKTKIVGLFVCLLLLLSTSTLALTPFSRDEQQADHRFFDASPIPLPTSGGWTKTFDRTYLDAGWSVQQTADGGYIIAVENYGENGDIWVIKTDGDGNKLWDRTFGGSGWEYRPDVKQTNDNGYIITARTYSFGVGNASNIWVLKLDENGMEQWNTTFGKEFNDYGNEIQQTKDGGYIIIGCVALYEMAHYDIGLIKIDSLGHEQWNRTFGGKGQEFGESVRQTSDGGYIVSGSTTSYGNTHGYVFWLIKTDAQGNEQWNRTYGGTSPPAGPIGNTVDLTSDGGYFLLETRHSNESEDDIWVIKTNQYGDEQWNKTFGGIYYEDGAEAYQTTDGGYIILGNTMDFNVFVNPWMIKLDASGEEQWNRTLGENIGGVGHSVDLTSDGGYIITGSTATFSEYDAGDVWLIKTDENGFVTNPPDTPTVTGETNGFIRLTYRYTVQTTDPDQDDVRYYIDWGDNTTTFTGLNESGEEIIVSHSWDTTRTYNIKVMAVDENYAASDWATLTVTMPYSYNKPILQFLELLFQRFPNAFPLLQQFFGY